MSPICPLCFEPAAKPERCKHCQTAYHAACLDLADCVVAGCPPPPPVRKRRPTARLVELAIVFMIIGVLAAIAVPNFKPCRDRSPTRSCYANQKTVVGAMEMYNLDKNTKRTTLDAAFFTALKSGGYLQSIPQDPYEGPGSSSNYQATDVNNGIKCVKHGAIQ